MTVVAITGGIAMGKSEAFKRLCEIFQSSVSFDADMCVSELLTRKDICERIQTEFGESVVNSNGLIDRNYLRDQVFDSAGRRAKLEGILHPEVRGEYLSIVRSAEQSGVNLLFADIPLLFESTHKYQRDFTLVVACDVETQMQRLLERPGITSKAARKMIDAQLPIEHKTKLADHVVWNSGNLKQLEKQIYYFALWLKQKI